MSGGTVVYEVGPLVSLGVVLGALTLVGYALLQVARELFTATRAGKGAGMGTEGDGGPRLVTTRHYTDAQLGGLPHSALLQLLATTRARGTFHDLGRVQAALMRHVRRPEPGGGGR